MTGAGERIVSANGVALCAETFGDPGDPAILLISGAAASMDWWDEEFCDRLAAGGRCVIRYDHRDTGRSVSYPPGAPGYTGADLVADAVVLLDALHARASLRYRPCQTGSGRSSPTRHPGQTGPTGRP